MYKRILFAIDSSTTAAGKPLGRIDPHGPCLGADLCIAYAADEASSSRHAGLGSYIDIEKVKGEIRLLPGGQPTSWSKQWPRQSPGLQTEHMFLLESANRRIADMIIDVLVSWGADLIVSRNTRQARLRAHAGGSVAETWSHRRKHRCYWCASSSNQ